MWNNLEGNNHVYVRNISQVNVGVLSNYCLSERYKNDNLSNQISEFSIYYIQVVMVTLTINNTKHTEYTIYINLVYINIWTFYSVIILEQKYMKRRSLIHNVFCFISYKYTSSQNNYSFSPKVI